MGGIVIIGAGECGARAAFALREAGYAGAVTLVGAEGILPYERPPLSKPHAEDEPFPKHVADMGRYRDARIALRLGATATTLDRREKSVRLADGERLFYDRLLLATGARARRFPDAEGVLTLRTAEDAVALFPHLRAERRIVIIGAGFIGLELAALARKAGAEVTVLEAAPRPLMRAVPQALAEALAMRHRAEGVTLHCGVSLARIAADGVTLTSGVRFEADRVIAGIGAEPNVALAQTAGLAVDNGIVVDATLQTADPSIFAAGDCCAFPYRGRWIRLESWRNAQDQAAHAARAMLGSTAPYTKVPWFWSDQYDLGLQIAGIFDPEAPTVRRDLGEDAFLLFQHDETGALAAAGGIGIGNRVSKDIRLAEMLIERRVRVEESQLAAADVSLKKFLAA